MNYILIFSSVCLSAFSQIILRYGMTRPAITEALSGTMSTASAIMTVATSPFVILGLGCYGVGAIVWLLVLARIPVSFAYPFVSLGIVLTTLSGVLVLRETISLTACIGIALIIGGILCVAAGR